jgi:hypothetical protein
VNAIPDVVAAPPGIRTTLDLPLPKLSSKAVTATMKGVVAKMGDRFSANLLERLGAEEV